MQNTNGQGGKGGLSWSTSSNQEKQSPLMPASKGPATPTPVPPPTGGNNTAKYVGMLVVGVIAGVLLAWGFTSMRNSSGAVSNTATSTQQGGTNTANGAAAGNNLAIGSDPSLTVASPQKPGSSVAIAKAIVSQPTWVVVYENSNGQPGRALGAGLFFPNKQSGTVELLRSTVAGKSYLVTKQTDNGDRKFSLRNDPVVTENGQAMWVTLQVQ